MTPPADSPDIVLIVSADAIAAALLGGLIETLGYMVQFAGVSELSDERLRRVRPRIYAIDCATTGDCSDEVIGRAIMRGVGVLLVGPPALMSEMRELAARHELEIVFTPMEAGPLGEALRRAARQSVVSAEPGRGTSRVPRTFRDGRP